MPNFCEWDNGACIYCGVKQTRGIVRNCTAPNASKKIPGITPVPSQRMLLGDKIEAKLIDIGITKEKWAAFTTLHGQPPSGGCGGCDARQEFLNNADQYMCDVVSDLGERAADAIATFWAPIDWLKNRKR